MESSDGKTAENTLENGLTTNFTAEELSFGPEDRNTRASIRTIKKKDSESTTSLGRETDTMKVSGLTTCTMEKEK